MPSNIDIGYNIEKRTAELIFDPRVFKEGDVKQVKVWSWKKFKYIVYLIIFKNDRFIIEKLE